MIVNYWIKKVAKKSIILDKDLKFKYHKLFYENKFIFKRFLLKINVTECVFLSKNSKD